MSSSTPSLPDDDQYPTRNSGGAYPAPTPIPRAVEPTGSASGSEMELLTIAMVWVGGAVSAGVLGNATYDLLKATVSRLLSRQADTKVVLSQTQAVQIARVALRERIEQIGVDDFPADVQLRVRDWWLSETEWWITLVGPGVRARMKVPKSVGSKDAIGVDVEVWAHKS